MRYLKMFVAVLLVLILSGGQGVFAVQEIKETHIVASLIDKCVKTCSKVLRDSHEMMYEAQPFTNPRFQDRFRFAPPDSRARRVMSNARTINSTLNTLTGALCHVPIQGISSKFKMAHNSLNAMEIFGKRALRAIRDNNFALYLASAQAIEKEVFLVHTYLQDLEKMVNFSIEASDAKYEDL